MKAITLLASILAALSFSSCQNLSFSSRQNKEKEKTTTNQPTSTQPMYRHVVFFDFKDSASKEQIAHIEKEFVALKEKIDLIKDLEWGTNISPEGLDHGHTHCFIVTFEDKAACEEYLPHPEHKKFVDQAIPLLEKATVLDFIPQ